MGEKRMKALNQPKFTGLLLLIVRLWLGYEWLTSGMKKALGDSRAAWVDPKAGTGAIR
jgi:uncharacterized membrane protein YphA (DoxX/SURF4 family)